MRRGHMRTRAIPALACLLAALSLPAWDGPKLTVEPDAACVRRTWADVRDSIAASIAKTGDGYFVYSRRFNDIGPIDTSGTLTDEELKTQFAMACVLASPITVRGRPRPQVSEWLGNKMLMNVNNDKVARQGHVVAERDGTFVILKYLWGMNGGNCAVAFYNPTDKPRRVSATARELSLSGTVKWTDRFDPAVTGSFTGELAFDVPAHGARLVYANGAPLMRSEYRRECAQLSGGALVWKSVFVPRDGKYVLTVGTHDSAPYRVKVNGLDLGERRGAASLEVQLFEPENTVAVSGGASVDRIWVTRTGSMLDAVTTAYRLARYGKDYEANQVYSTAAALPIGELEPAGPDEENALKWIHETLWTWQFDWLWARCAEAAGDKARAVKLVETGCFRFRDRYGIEPDDPAFWQHYEKLTGKKREEGKAKKESSSGGQQAQSYAKWQVGHAAELARAVADESLDAALASDAAADALLAEVAGAYDTDPLAATKIAAVTARAMEPGAGAKRRVWAGALLKAALAATDGYRAVFFLEQLRWCRFREQLPEIDGLASKATAEGVASFAAMLARELRACPQKAGACPRGQKLGNDPMENRRWAEGRTVPRTFVDSRGGRLHYRLHEPEIVREGQKYPLVVFLHGAGERGDDNVLQLIHGVPQIINFSERMDMPCYVVAAQVPRVQLDNDPQGLKWVGVPWDSPEPHKIPGEPSAPMASLIELVDHFRGLPSVDADRVYATGLSMGGFGTWDLVMRRPEWFAAAIPICGGGDPSEAARLRAVHVRIFHGGADTAVPTVRGRIMFEALKAAGCDVGYREYPGVGHNSWAPTYADDEVLSWLFRQTRRK